MTFFCTDQYPSVLKVKDIKSILQIGRVQAYDLIHSGEFPVKKIGNTYRIPKEPFVAWLHNNLL